MNAQTDPSPDQNHSVNGTEAPEPSLPSTTKHNNPITLQVGESRFHTFSSTLTPESPYFACLLSAQWHQHQPDGSYFVDADGDLFSHILRYLRSGILPLFYSSLTGHDYGTYRALLGEAEYFGIERLKDWLRNKEYEKAVKIECSVEEVEGLGGMAWTGQANVEVEYHPAWTTRKVYICPRRISVHNGDPSACRRACRKSQGDAEDEFEDEEVLRTIVISRRTGVGSWFGPSE